MRAMDGFKDCTGLETCDTPVLHVASAGLPLSLVRKVCNYNDLY